MRGVAAVSLVIGTLLAACGGEPAEPEPTAPATLTISPAIDTLTSLSERASLSVIVRDASGTVLSDALVSWVSTDPDIAAVDAGTVTAHANGTTTIVATAGDAADTSRIVVQQRVDTVVITLGEGPLVEGDTLHVEAVARDAGGAAIAGVQPTLSVINATVMILEAPTRLRGLQPGSAALTASAEGKSTTTALPVVLRFSAITVGGSHACGLATSGNAYCWGIGDDGQLGTGSANNALVPARVTGGRSWRALTAGYKFTCGIADDALSYCWGLNDEGQFGDGTTTSSTVPTIAGGGTQYGQIESGSRHVCGRAASDAYCWGANSARQLGDSMTVTGSGFSVVPTRVRGDVALYGFSGGSDHTCALDGTGLAYCWGSNFGYKVGVDTGYIAAFPLEVSGQRAFVSVEAGSGATCAITAAGALYCWGTDANAGALGTTETAQTCDTGIQGDPLAPCTSIPLPILAGTAIAQVSSGIGETCAVSGDGVAYCWGMDLDGSLGAPPPETCNASSPVGCARTPIQVSGGITFSSIAVGFGVVCGTATDGRIYCWGTGGFLGVGDSQSRSQPTPVALQ